MLKKRLIKKRNVNNVLYYLFGGFFRAIGRRLANGLRRTSTANVSRRFISSPIGKKVAGRIIGTKLGFNVGKTKLGLEAPTLTYKHLGNTWFKSTPMKGVPKANGKTVHRTSALNFKLWVKSGKVNLDNPDLAVIEIASHPTGHLTVKPRHLVDGNNNDITLSFDEGTNRPNLILLRFDDSHLKTDWSLEDVLEALSLGQWKGTPIAENPLPILFKNITDTQADDLVNFIDDNNTKDIFVHCLQGKSRSGAVDKFLRDFYGYEGTQGSNTDKYSPEVYKSLVKAYIKKHKGISYYN